MRSIGDDPAVAKTRPIHVEWRYLIGGLFVLDLAGLLLAVGLAYQARFLWPFLPYGELTDPQVHFAITLLIVPVWLALFWLHRLYDPNLLLGGVKEYSFVVNASTYGVMAVIILAFLGRVDGALSRGWLILVWVLSIFLVGSLRFAARRVAHRLRRRGLFVRKAIVAGADTQGIALARHVSPSHETGIEVIGFVHDYLAPGSIVGDGFRVLGEPMELAAVAKKHQADLVIVVPGALSWESLQTVMQLAADGKTAFKCRLLPGLYDVVASGVSVDESVPIPLLSLNRVRITGSDRVLKGVLDYLGAALLLAATPPLAVLLTLLSMRKGGPVLEGREYVGAMGKPFLALAFRGWWNGEILRSGSNLERYLYRRRLYRVPGLLNVLKGEMSLVGPRRVVAEELSHQPNWRHNLLSVKPGLTGPWLLAGGERLTLEESLQLDLHYVRNYSVWLDLQILFRTFWLLQRGFEPQESEGERSSAVPLGGKAHGHAPSVPPRDLQVPPPGSASPLPKHSVQLPGTIGRQD